MKKPIYYREAPYRIERGGPDRRGRPSYHWVTAYLREDGAHAHAATYRECQAEARDEGGKAVFLDRYQELTR